MGVVRWGLLVFATLLVIGCGDRDIESIKKAVKERLVDPDSAKFGTVAFTPDESEACIEYNSKNRMGGYAGTSIALMKKKSGKWEVDLMEWRAENCSKAGRVIAGPN